MVHVSEHLTSSQPPSRTPQHSSGYRVQDDKGQMGLAITPQNLPEDQSEMGSICSGPVCIQTHTPTASIFQLETRSSGSSDRCLPSSVAITDKLCKPSLGSNIESPIGNQPPTSRSCDCSSSLEESVLVSSSAIPTIRLSPPHNISTRSTAVPGVSVTSIPAPGSTAGRMAHLRNFCQAEKFSKQASELLLASWRDKSTKAYNSLFHKWECWCVQRDRNPISGPVADIANFLAELYQDGYAYSSLNSYRSAISSVHEHIEGYPVGQHPQIARILKGAYNLRPPKPRYSNTWKVSTVVTWLDSIDLKSSGLSLMELSIKTVLLLALTRPLRSADLASFQLSNIRYLPEGVIITPSHLSKQSRMGKSVKDFFFPAFTVNPNLCPVNTVKAYIERTSSLRASEKFLFLTAVPKHHPATASTIARWIKAGLTKAGIDTNIFKAHSVRSASTSAAADAGISISEILEAADWSSASTFEKFYYRPIKSSKFGLSVVSSASNLQC